MQHFDLHKLPQSKLANVNILCLVLFGSGRNKLVQLLIQSQNSGGQTIRSLPLKLRIQNFRHIHLIFDILSTKTFNVHSSNYNTFKNERSLALIENHTVMLPSLTVSNDKLSLSTADRYQTVDCLDASLHRFLH